MFRWPPRLADVERVLRRRNNWCAGWEARWGQGCWKDARRS